MEVTEIILAKIPSNDETIQNNQKSIGKPIPAYGFKKSKEKICEPKVSRLLPNLRDFQ
jgi:hypothetical protein